MSVHSAPASVTERPAVRALWVACLVVGFTLLFWAALTWGDTIIEAISSAF